MIRPKHQTNKEYKRCINNYQNYLIISIFPEQDKKYKRDIDMYIYNLDGRYKLLLL